MNRYFSKILPFVLLLIGCTANKRLTCTLQPNQIAFIESYTTIEGKPIEGIAPEGRRIGGQPVYYYNNFDSSISIVSNKINTNFNNVIAVLGSKGVLLGTAGSGIASEIVGIDNTPFNYKDLEIKSITANYISLNIKGKKARIKIGDYWESKSSRIDTLNFDESKCVIETINTQKITFHGIVNRTKIIFN